MKPVEAMGEPSAHVARARYGRLFRKYFLLILALVCGALVISGATGLFFSYQENRDALAALQREKALAAAGHIEQFVRRVAQQLAFAAPQVGGESIEQRRLELLKVLRLAKEVTDLSQIGADGREQLSESRLAMAVTGSGKDRSQEPAFRNPRPGRPWFGPVYFRKETEPYMSVAVRSGGEKGPVTVAEVNLKFIWDVVTRIKVGEKGKAYVVDGKGYLIADPDIGLVLRKTDLSGLEQVRAALHGDQAERAIVAHDASGRAVLTAWAPVDPREEREGSPDPLGWKVFVEQPASEVFQALNASILRAIALIVAGLVLSAFAAVWLARSMAEPIGVLREGAQRIGAGELDHEIRVRTGDELEALAEQFNRMSAQLRESYAGLERKVAERTAELKEALEQQTAISEILRVISSSPGDVTPVLQAVAERAAHICGAQFADIIVAEGGKIRVGAAFGELGRPVGELLELDRATVMGRAIVDRAPVHVADLQSEEIEFPQGAMLARKYGHRSILAVPLVRETKSLGTILVRRTEVRPFEEKHIALLKTFADQAAIAIENVRLFNETKEALERQTATAEILEVMSRSQSDLQPMFDTIAANARRLCGGDQCVVGILDGGLIHLASIKAMTPEEAESTRRAWPRPPGRGSGMGRAILTRSICQLPDVLKDSEYELGSTAQAAGWRSVVSVPMLRGGNPIGAISVLRRHPGPYADDQVALLKTFADQAVIAIENVRLFNETREALEQQTAISEVLRVISSSPSDVNPVLQAVAERAARICEAQDARIFVVEGNNLRFMEQVGGVPGAFRAGDVRPIDRTYVAGRCAFDKAVIHIEDIDALADEYPTGQALSKKYGIRTFLAVPLLREDRVLGTILLRRAEVRPFTEKQIALLRTFADQGAIAIENVRLFNETKEALEQQTAISEVLRVISSTPSNVKPTLEAVAERATRLCDAPAAAIYVLEDEVLRRTAFHGPADLQGDETLPFNPEMLTGRVVLEGKPIHVHDIERERTSFPMSWQLAQRYGRHTMLAVPLMREGKPFGTMFLRRTEVRPFSDKQIALATTFADQAAIAIENVRLFREIQEKSAQLEIANKHKSEFLANMSHELRTPLNAIIGFSEVLMERMFGEVNEKQADYLKDIHESGRHLLSLINDILDLSKIEAGRMELELSSFHLPTALSNAMTLVRERAQRHGITLGLEVDKRLGEFQADERKFKQIVLNLLSNAVKFTPDGGRVDVSAKLDTTNIEVAVRDTGIGIAPADQGLVFEEFRQVGRDYTRKAEGTGLGLALTKRFVELHGGEIRLESAPGKGSTFTFTLPVRP